MATKKPKSTSPVIAENKKAAFNYFFEDRFEAGMVLEGWEVKALRAGKAQLTDGYVVIRNGELFVIGAQINPLGTASTHVRPDAVRTKKLLGAHILGPQASTLIQPLIQAMSFGLDVPSMARGQYWIHPALTEVVENALLGLDI